MFRDKGQRINEAHVKHVVTAFVRLRSHPHRCGGLGAADDKDKALNYPAALAAKPTTRWNRRRRKKLLLLNPPHSFRLRPRESPRH
jgi:hypothetical protein